MWASLKRLHANASDVRWNISGWTKWTVMPKSVYKSWICVSSCWGPFHSAKNCCQLALFSFIITLNRWLAVPWLGSSYFGIQHFLRLDQSTVCTGCMSSISIKMSLSSIFITDMTAQYCVSLLLIQRDGGFRWFTFSWSSLVCHISRTHCDGVPVNLKRWNVIMGLW